MISLIKTFMNICMNKMKLSWISPQGKCFLKDKRKCLKKLTKEKIKFWKKTPSTTKNNFKELPI